MHYPMGLKTRLKQSTSRTIMIIIHHLITLPSRLPRPIHHSQISHQLDTVYYYTTTSLHSQVLYSTSTRSPASPHLPEQQTTPDSTHTHPPRLTPMAEKCGPSSTVKGDASICGQKSCNTRIRGGVEGVDEVEDGGKHRTDESTQTRRSTSYL